MREIKFRVWDKVNQTMSPTMTLVEILQAEALPLPEGMPPSLFFRGLEWRQYTGLKDKNGKEILEGDILLVPDEWTEPVLDDGSGPREPCNHLAPVTFEGGAFGVAILDKADIYSKGFWSFPVIIYEIGDKPEEFEVIGNIYENPELLGR